MYRRSIGTSLGGLCWQLCGLPSVRTLLVYVRVLCGLEKDGRHNRTSVFVSPLRFADDNVR